MIETPGSMAKLSSADVRELIDDIYSDGLIEVARLVRRHNGTADDARDIFHDALMVLIRHIEAGRAIDAPLSYLLGTARHLLYRRLNTETVRGLDEIDAAAFAEPEEPAIANLGKILGLVRRTGRNCLDFLTAIFVERKELSSVTREFGLKSEHVASVKKYKCLEQVRNIVKEKALDYEDFTD